MSGYREVLRTPGVARVLGAQLTARFPAGMISLAFLLHLQQVHDSYAAAGLVLAATSAGQAIAGPLTSRWMGRWRIRPVILLTLTVCFAAYLTIALVPMAVWTTMIVGLIGGLSNPPIQSAVRTIYPKLVNSKQLTPLFALDASAQEIIWVIGPVATTFIAMQLAPALAILAAAAFLLGGGLWFALSPEVGKVRIPRSRRVLGQVLLRRPVLLATIVGLLLVGGTAALEAGVVAVYGHGRLEAGVLLSIWSIGSLAGGLLLGHAPIGPWALARRMFVVFAGTALAALMLDFWWLALTLFIAGLGLAPALAVMFSIVSASVSFSDTAEAYGWIGTGQLMGAALGSAVAGFMIDGNGAIGGFIVGAVLALAGAVVPVVFRRWHPDLRGREAGPLPETQPVPVPRT